MPLVPPALAHGLLACLAVACASPAPPADGVPRQHQGLTYRAFADVNDAVRAAIPPDARVVAFGELHARTDRPEARSSLARFVDGILPTVASEFSDLILETWVVDPKCGQPAAQATARVEAAMRRPASTQGELAAGMQAARAANVKVHAMRLACDDYARVAPEAGVDAEALLDLVTGELTRVALSAVRYRDAEAGARPRIAIYGGALHNDRFPYASVQAWSIAAAVDAATGGRYAEIDLYAPELAEADPVARAEPWAPLLALTRTDRAILWQRGERSALILLPRGPAP